MPCEAPAQTGDEHVQDGEDCGGRCGVDLYIPPPPPTSASSRGRGAVWGIKVSTNICSKSQYSAFGGIYGEMETLGVETFLETEFRMLLYKDLH